MGAKTVNLAGKKNGVWGISNKTSEMVKEGKIEEIMVIWKNKSGGMHFSHSDLSSILFLGMMKLIGDDISEYKRENE